jgi:hypothetical protein
MNGQQQPQQLDINTPVPVTLPFGAWNGVLSLLMKGSWDIANPLINAIQQQLQAVQQRALQPQPALQAPGQPLPPRGPNRQFDPQQE